MYRIIKNRKGHILYSVFFLERPSIEKDYFTSFIYFLVKEIVFSSTTLLFTKNLKYIMINISILCHYDSYRH